MTFNTNYHTLHSSSSSERRHVYVCVCVFRNCGMHGSKCWRSVHPMAGLGRRRRSIYKRPSGRVSAPVFARRR